MGRNWHNVWVWFWGLSNFDSNYILCGKWEKFLGSYKPNLFSSFYFFFSFKFVQFNFCDLTSLTCLQVSNVQFSYGSLVIKMISFKNRLNLLLLGLNFGSLVQTANWWIYYAVVCSCRCMEIKFKVYLESPNNNSNGTKGF